jgi:hypothetical protein
MSVKNLGQALTVTATFENSAGTKVDPTTVKADVTTPAGTETTYTYPASTQLVKSSTGIYVLTLTMDAVGPWYGRIYSTGTGQDAEHFHVDVRGYTP